MGRKKPGPKCPKTGQKKPGPKCPKILKGEKIMQKKGYVSFVLHAHLPFIHHPESDDYLEESWLYEAISET